MEAHIDTKLGQNEARVNPNSLTPRNAESAQQKGLNILNS